MCANGYRCPGRKMKSRFDMSHKDIRQAVKSGMIPCDGEMKAYGRDPHYSSKEWARLQRMSLRQRRVLEKSIPMFDMDGSYYHG